MVGESINEIDMRASSEPMYKAFVYILIELQPKLLSKYKELNIHNKKAANLTLKYQQAFTLDWYLANYLDNIDDEPVVKSVLKAFKLQLNQKLYT